MSISPDRILYLDDTLLAVNKRSGELVVRGAGDVGKLPLLDFLKKDYPGLHTLHRLDFETSGVVLFARNSTVAKQVLASKFDGWKKIYRTLVFGRMKKIGIIDRPLPTRKSSGRAMLRPSRRPAPCLHFEAPSEHLSVTQGAGLLRMTQAQHGTSEAPDWVGATTRYRVLENFGDVSYVEAEIETGRHHQVRKHFAAIGHPLILDEVYGDKKFNRWFAREFGYRKFFLHAKRIELPHPVTGERLMIEAKLPSAFEECLRKMRSPSP